MIRVALLLGLALALPSVPSAHACALAPDERVIADSGQAVITHRPVRNGEGVSWIQRARLRSTDRFTPIGTSAEYDREYVAVERALLAGRFAAVVWEDVDRYSDRLYYVTIVDLRVRRPAVRLAELYRCSSCEDAAPFSFVLGTRGHLGWVVGSSGHESIVAQAGRRRVEVTPPAPAGTLTNLRIVGARLEWRENGLARSRRLPAIA